MGPRCCFDKLSLPLVVDTSVAINLNATGYASIVIKAIPNELAIVDVVHEELNGGTLKGKNDAKFTSGLVESGMIQIMHLGDVGTSLFEELISGGATQSLDDGEAATIAFAIEAGAIALIDERKATRICGKRFPKLLLACTMDLLAHPDVRSSLGQVALADAVFNALQAARMNVHMHHLAWVVDLIGRERVAQCRSLPRRIRIGGLCT